MIKQRTQAGFTLIEMLLAMAFVAFLMITIALTTINMARTYQRGMTLSNVNSAGRAIVTDMRRTISQAPASDLAAGADTPPFTQKLTSTGGAICFGNYSYVWNNGSAIAAKSGQLIKYQGGKIVRLAKVLDGGKSECPTDGDTIPSPDPNSSTELLPSDDAANMSYDGLALQKQDKAFSAITVTAGAHDATQALYQVSFTIGTNDQNALDLSSESGFGSSELRAPSCKPPSDSDGNLDYCAVNRFTFLVRAGGGVVDAS